LANYWLHNGMLDFGGKMSKERGNVIYMRAGPMPWDGQSGLLSLYGSDTVRYFLMTAHYRQPLTYTTASLDRAEISMRSLRRALAKYAFERPREIAYVGGLADDLNTPRAISEAHALANVINRGEETTEQAEQYYSLMDALGMVGLFSRVLNPHDHEVEEMLQQRTMARDRRDFAEADRLRDLILARGVEVNDAPLKG
jgi:cysteinyl-tRNA synthetase